MQGIRQYIQKNILHAFEAKAVYWSIITNVMLLKSYILHLGVIKTMKIIPSKNVFYSASFTYVYNGIMGFSWAYLIINDLPMYISNTIKIKEEKMYVWNTTTLWTNSISELGKYWMNIWLSQSSRVLYHPITQVNRYREINLSICMMFLVSRIDHHPKEWMKSTIFHLLNFVIYVL